MSLTKLTGFKKLGIDAERKNALVLKSAPKPKTGKTAFPSFVIAGLAVFVILSRLSISVILDVAPALIPKKSFDSPPMLN